MGDAHRKQMGFPVLERISIRISVVVIVIRVRRVDSFANLGLEEAEELERSFVRFRWQIVDPSGPSVLGITCFEC